MAIRKITFTIILFAAFVIGLVIGVIGCGGGGGGGGQPREAVSPARVTSDGRTVTFIPPPNWTISSEDSKRELYSPSSTRAIAEGDLVTSPDITTALLKNPSNLSLRDFVNTYRGGWFAHYKEIAPTTVNGREAIRVSDLTAEIPHSPELAVFIAVDNMVSLVTGQENSQQQFNEFVTSLRFP